MIYSQRDPQGNVECPNCSHSFPVHKNNDKQDNRIENLELTTPQMNTAYALRDGLMQGARA